MKTRLIALVGALAIGPAGLAATATMAPATAAAPSGTATAPAATTASAPAYELVDGVTAPIYDYAEAIRETVWVDAPDLDGDGKGERIATDIVRPRELDGVGKVPIVMDASPYYLSLGRGNEGEFKTYDAQGNPLKMPLAYDNFFVPRGYAFVAPDMAGTGRSTGCTDEGGRSDIESVKVVVEWLAGKGTATDRDGKPVSATWSTGKTGMIGKSYDGTLANGVAATGAEGLTTIVPVAAISSWYDYNRWQGVPKSYNYPTSLSRTIARNRTVVTDCSERLDWMAANDGDETGEYTDFWAERDYREGTFYDASKVKASALIVHGLQDNNVKTPNFSKWWEALGEQGVERKLFLTRLGHVDPFDSDRERWTGILQRWFDHQLLGIDNGIDREPAVSVEVAPNRWSESRTWPISSARTQTLQPQAGGTLALGAKGSGTAMFTNQPALTESAAVMPGANSGRLLFTTGTLKKELRLSGTATVDLGISHTAPTGQVSVSLVDYGEADRVLSTGDGAQTLTTESCWGESTSYDDACYKDVTRRIGSTPLQVLARGWARLGGAGSHQVTVELMANDVVVPAGHQLGLVVRAADRSWVVTLDDQPTPYTVDLAATRVNLPVSGSMSGMTRGALTVRPLPAGTTAQADPNAVPR